MNDTPHNIVSFVEATRLETLLRHVAPVVSEVPHGVMLDRVRQSYIEFARRSSILVAKLVIDYQANVHDYPMTPPDGYIVHQVMGLDSPGYRFVDYWHGTNYGLWGTKFDVIDNKYIYIHRAPSVDGEAGLVVYAQLLPDSCCEHIPVSLEVPYGKGIADGAIAALLRIPNKPWTQPGIARQYEMDYNRTVMAARNLADSNRKRGPLRPYQRRIV